MHYTFFLLPLSYRSGMISNQAVLVSNQAIYFITKHTCFCHHITRQLGHQTIMQDTFFTHPLRFPSYIVWIACAECRHQLAPINFHSMFLGALIFMYVFEIHTLRDYDRVQCDDCCQSSEQSCCSYSLTTL